MVGTVLVERGQVIAAATAGQAAMPGRACGGSEC
jgi:hypothetical protein